MSHQLMLQVQHLNDLFGTVVKTRFFEDSRFQNSRKSEN